MKWRQSEVKWGIYISKLARLPLCPILSLALHIAGYPVPTIGRGDGWEGYCVEDAVHGLPFTLPKKQE